MNGKETEVVAKDRILRMPEVSEMTTLAEQTLYSMQAKGTGPRSFKLGGRIAYRESAVLEWLAQQEQAEEDRLNRLQARTTAG